MGRAAAVLSGQLDGRRRVAAGAVVAGAVAAYDALADRLPDLSPWADTVFTAGVLMPVVLSLVWLSLPLRRWRGVVAVTVALGVLGAVWYAAGLDVAANLAKLAAAALGGFCFLTVFERASWVVLVAFVVPIVDGLSVWRGPTREIVGDRPEVFGALSVSFPSPGGGAFQLGLPDVIFFALFLAAAARWRLRPGLTWLALTASLGLTITLAVAIDPFGIGGLPALPGLSLAFLAANGDLLLRGLRGDVQAHVPATLSSAEPDALAAFYRQAFRARAERQGEAQLRVWASWTVTADEPAELGFEVDHVAGAFERAVEAGARPVAAPAEGSWGAVSRVRDPAGHIVVLRESEGARESA